MRRVSSFLLFLMLASQVWADTHDIEFAGSQFQPAVHTIDGRSFYQTEDQEIQRLLSRANITLQWSSSGQTLFAFAPGRESYWTAGSERATVNKKEVEAPGKLLVKDGTRYIEPEALFFALATRGAKNGSGYNLFPVITEVTQSDSGFLLRSASKASPRVVTNGDSTVFAIDNFAWDGPAKLEMGDTLFEFKGGAKKGHPLEVTVTPRPFYAAKLGGSTLLNETKINIAPNFAGAENGSDVSLNSLLAQESEGLDMLVLEFDRGTKVHYAKNASTGDLTLYLPWVTNNAGHFKSSQWPGVELTSYRTSKYPVLEIKIPGKSAYEFVTLEDAPHSIALLKGSKSELKDIAASGSVETPGWTNVNVQGTIVIDPGHGGSDPGCVNRALGTREADVTLKISKHLAELLRAQGWNVILTRETDRDVTYAGSPDRMELEARAQIANQIGADLFMSIHCDASVSASSRGSSIHWWKAEDYAFAQALEPVLGTAIGLGQKGLIRNRFVVLRHAQMPSVLVETAFLSNPIEGAKLSDPEFQKVIAQQLAGGLANYMRGAYASRGGKRAVD